MPELPRDGDRSAVRSDRRFRFDVEPAVTWDALTSVESYQRWWPWLRRFEAAGFEPGATWRCTVQPPLPYSLRFELRLEEVEAERYATALVDGDIRGHAALELSPTGDGATEVRLVSVLAPASGVLRAVTRVAAPVARYGHDWVLDAGLRQFRQRALDGR